MNRRKLNEVSIKPVITANKYSKKNVRAYDYYPEPYANVCLLARKKSGKSTVIYRALEQCCKKGTNVCVFSPTCLIDPTYIKMKKMLEKKGCNVMFKEHFIEDGVNLVSELYNAIKDGEEDEDDIQDIEIEDIKPPLFIFGNDRRFIQEQNPDGSVELTPKPQTKQKAKEKKKKKKDKLLTPEHIFVFDDLSQEMRNPSISRMLVKNRHIKCKVFLSCHSVNNLDRMALESIDAYHVFGNIPDEKIKELQDKINLTFKSDTKKQSKLQQLYDDATSKPYNFLYIDRANCTFRKNFNELYNVDE